MNKTLSRKNGADFDKRQFYTKQRSGCTGRCSRFAVFISTKMEVFEMNVRNEIKAQIIRAGMTMQEVVDLLSTEYGWSDSVSNLSAKLQRGSIRYKEVLELADVLGYDVVWVKRRDEK